jgi:hypothetical protein
MKPPIIINENGDISIYDSLEKAELDIEPPDVKNNIYTIYDSEGLMLTPVVIDDPIYDVVKIYATDEKRPVELIRALIDFLSETGHDSLILRTMALEELVKLRMEYER